jgi:hypothetical protein
MPMFPEEESNQDWDFDVFIDRMDSPVNELRFEEASSIWQCG